MRPDPFGLPMAIWSARSGPSTMSLRLALRDLEGGHFIRADGSGGETRYRLVDPFFAHWLRIFQGP